GTLLYQALLLLTAAGFFIGFWIRGGQTLGMRAWRLRIERGTGEALDLRTGIVRFLAGLLSLGALGLGLVWIWLDRDRTSWHDRIAGTRFVVVRRAVARGS